MAIFDVHQVWPPVAAKQTDLTIILFHGLQMADQTDAWKYTWTTEKTQVFWPQEWLPEDLGKEKVRVLSVSYNSRASQWGKGDEEHEVKKFGSNLRHELIHE
ncbi:unnamed protein product [Sphagnum jensenii]|uniref:Alpha/beta-hydrolase n=1 Tax=Sphagnum jensenii TaxID=128206 RepID=A0ABP1BPY7_9BRYO